LNYFPDASILQKNKRSLEQNEKQDPDTFLAEKVAII